MTISKEVLDELLSGVENADDLLGNNGLMKELKVRLMERMLGAEPVDLSLFFAAPSAGLSHLAFESDGAFPAQC